MTMTGISRKQTDWIEVFQSVQLSGCTAFQHWLQNVIWNGTNIFQSCNHTILINA